MKSIRGFKNAHLKAFATVDPEALSPKDKGYNLVAGEWVDSHTTQVLIDPMTGKGMITLPDTQLDEIKPFVDSLKSCPKYGLHNPYLNKERYLMYGDICRKMCEVMYDPEVLEHMTRCLMRAVPKSHQQAQAEILVTMKFVENYCGDQVRFLARGFTNPGDHAGQMSQGFRWPFGPVGVITPFNFPIEIAVLQLMGALFMGNKPLVKPDIRCSFPLEQWVRMMHYCGMPKEDMDFIHGDGPVMEKILVQGGARNTLFTGSTAVGEHLSKVLKGRVRLEDGGYDWKVIGPDVPKNQADIDYVAW